jgi:rsbT co-antagonist protein RsbR
MGGKSAIPEILGRHERELVEDWLKELRDSGLARDGDLVAGAERFVALLREAVSGGDVSNPASPAFAELRRMLDETSRRRAREGFSASETATFVFSFKRPLFLRLRTELEKDPPRLADDIWSATELLDTLGLYTTEVAAKAREEVILRQQNDMLELSTPVVKLWDGVLALPLIGTLDSARTQVVMETLLTRINETGSSIAIIDITGVPTVDTLTAQHLIKTVTAARLMGAEAIISGIRPQIAQTIVHLGVDLGSVTTKATLADAFTLALTKLGLIPTNGARPAAPAARSPTVDASARSPHGPNGS